MANARSQAYRRAQEDAEAQEDAGSLGVLALARFDHAGFEMRLILFEPVFGLSGYIMGIF